MLYLLDFQDIQNIVDSYIEENNIFENTLIPDKVVIDLLSGKYTLKYIWIGNFTVSELVYCFEDSNNIFIGITSRRPGKPFDINYAMKISLERSLLELFNWIMEKEGEIK